MAKRRTRRGEPSPPAATVVIRGDLLYPDVLAESAQRNFDVFGFYGISMFAETADVSPRTFSSRSVSSASGAGSVPTTR